MWRLIKTDKMKYLLPQIVWTGMSLAFYTGALVPLIVQTTIPSEETGLKLALLCMAVLGLGEIVGATLIGKAIDTLQSKAISIFALASIAAQSALLLAFMLQDRFGPLAYLTSFAIGMQDSIVNTQTNRLLGFEFEDTVYPFAIFNFVQCLAVCFFLLLEGALSTNYSFVGVFGLLGILFCSALFKFPYKRPQSSEEKSY